MTLGAHLPVLTICGGWLVCPHYQIECHAVRYEVQRYGYAVNGSVGYLGRHDVGDLLIIGRTEDGGEYLDEVALADQQEEEDELYLGLLDLPIGRRVVAQLLREDPTQPVVDEGVEEADEQCYYVELGVAQEDLSKTVELN